MKNKKQKTILVTGGAGYIGSHVCKTLAKEGYLPVAYDNLESGKPSFVKWGPLVKGDLLNQKLLEKTLKKYQPYAIMHLAGCILVNESLTNPGKYYKNNLIATLHLLEAMTMSCKPAPHIVFSSSCSTYGHPQFTPLTEEHPQNPNTPYGKSKLMAEELIGEFSQIFGFKSVCLRYFNAAGADLETEIGEDHAVETHLIPLAILAALKGTNPLKIFGTDFPTEDGTAIRDYIHVMDIARAHLLALDWFEKEHTQNLKVNLGTGKGYSVKEIIEAIEAYGKKKVPVIHSPKREGDPCALFANNQLAQNSLGWQPLYSDLKTIIESAWRWHQKQHCP